MAVGAVEPQFYKQLLIGLDLTNVTQFQTDVVEYEECKKIFADRFKTKTRQEWCQVKKHNLEKFQRGHDKKNICNLFKISIYSGP